MRSFTAIILILLLTACDTVTTSEPIGDPERLDPASWNGVWIDQNVAITARVIDAATGRVEFGWIEAEKEGLRVERYTGEIRSAGGSQYGVLRSDETEPAFLFARLRMEEDRLLLWPPDFQAFEAAVSAGRLPGTVSDGQVRLGAPDAALIERLTAQGAVLFDREQPLNFIRVID